MRCGVHEALNLVDVATISAPVALQVVEHRPQDRLRIGNHGFVLNGVDLKRQNRRPMFHESIVLTVKRAEGIELACKRVAGAPKVLKETRQTRVKRVPNGMDDFGFRRQHCSEPQVHEVVRESINNHGRH